MSSESDISVKPKSSKLPIFIGVGVILMCCCYIIAFMMMRKKKDDKKPVTMTK